MSRFIAGVMSAVAIVIVALFLLPRLGWMYVTADRGPSSLEAHFANGALHSAVVRLSKGLRNPVPVTDANLIDGVRLNVRISTSPSTGFAGLVCPAGPTSSPTIRFGESQASWSAWTR
jgi:hypothetical protein